MALPHGGNIYYYSRKYGIPPGKFIDFSASINPLGPPKSAVAAMKSAMPLLVNYPDPEYGKLKAAISAQLGISPESILAGNGSTELIYLLPRVLKPKKAVVLAPSFSDYERALKLSGCDVRHFTLREKDGFMPDIDLLIRAAQGADMLVICNPNNPTGLLIEKSVLADVICSANRADTFVVVDEAFIEYAPGHSVAREAAGMKGVAVLRNFTKFYGMPGLRAGWLSGHPSLVKKLEDGKEPWSMNTLAEQAAAAALVDTAYAEKSLAQFNKEKEYLYRELCAIPGLVPYRSAANFFLMKLTSREMDADGLAEELASKGILIRSCSNFRGLGNKYIRVAVRTRAENRVLADFMGMAIKA